jgi:uncharacterized protein
MKQLLLTALFAVILSVGWAQDVPSKDLPDPQNPPRLVNDFAHILSPDAIQNLEARLVAFDDSTSVQIAVVTVGSTGDYEPADYALSLGRKWGIGNKGFNNGVVFLISKDDHKTYIATGYGLEGALPDITCNEILQNEVLPQFKAGDFDKGVTDGVSAIMLASKGEYKAPVGYHKQKGVGAGTAIFLVICVIILIVIIRSRGGGGGGYMSRRGYGAGPFLLGAAAGSLFGGGGGGGGFGGGGGGGGFGGFGGGGFGGGGAGGSW